MHSTPPILLIVSICVFAFLVFLNWKPKSITNTINYGFGQFLFWNIATIFFFAVYGYYSTPLFENNCSGGNWLIKGVFVLVVDLIAALVIIRLIFPRMMWDQLPQLRAENSAVQGLERLGQMEIIGFVLYHWYKATNC